MDHIISREKDVEYDLESGENSSEDDVSKCIGTTRERLLKNGLSRSWNGLLNLDGSNKPESGFESCSSSVRSDDVMDDNLELLVDRDLGEDVEEQLPLVNKFGKQKNKKTNCQKLSKPPRPPNGPSLDAADQKFVKEIAELALRKRARIKRMKAVKQMKRSKASSSSSPPSCTSLSAMFVTIVFLLVIILQGIRSGSSTAVGLMASPEPAVVADESMISVQDTKNLITNVGDASGLRYPIPQDR